MEVHWLRSKEVCLNFETIIIYAGSFLVGNFGYNFSERISDEVQDILGFLGQEDQAEQEVDD